MIMFLLGPMLQWFPVIFLISHLLYYTFSNAQLSLAWTAQSIDYSSLSLTLIPTHTAPAHLNPILNSNAQLSLAWTTQSIDYSPLGLFGKLSVNVEVSKLLTI
jgi:hypothetical protein